ncbi:MAG: TIGR02996 domain-containing protein [Planctomycetia bacterium]|nr:TIGR02996 domain-containing protein [Planctomycetia bacterium]
MNSWPAEISLLRTIIDQPDDDTPRLIYADWLEEQGEQPRAELIRVQVEAADLFRRRYDVQRAIGLRDRGFALLRQHEKHWAREFQPYVENWTFERGFIEYIALPASDFVARGDFLFERAPIRRMYLLGVGDLLPKIVESPHLARLTTLYLRGAIGEITEHLTKSPYLEQIEQLELMGLRLSFEEQRVLIGRFGNRVRF